MRTAWDDVSAEVARIQADIDTHDADPEPSWKKAIQGTVSVARDVLVALSTPATGSTVSALIRAQAWEGLTTPALDAFVAIKGGTASVTQLLNDRQIGHDTVSIVSSATIAFVAVGGNNSFVRVGGFGHGLVQMHGRIGEALTNPV